MIVYCVASDFFEDGESYFTGIKEAMAAGREAAKQSPATVTRIKISRAVNGRAFAVLLLNGRGFAEETETIAELGW